ADDYFETDALAKVVKALDANKSYKFAVANTRDFGKRERIVKARQFTWHDMMRQNCAYGEVVYDADAHHIHHVRYVAMLQDEQGRGFGAVDYHFILQLMHDLNWQCLVLDDVLLLNYNVRDNSISSKTKQHSAQVLQKLKEHFAELEMVHI
ncbi:MAG: hypothetical protein CUN55_18615, partial [Phototrophicales bacterium]